LSDGEDAAVTDGDAVEMWAQISKVTASDHGVFPWSLGFTR
jgi:hypothetical protein